LQKVYHTKYFTRKLKTIAKKISQQNL